jgi:hypothetical protein
MPILYGKIMPLMKAKCNKYIISVYLPKNERALVMIILNLKFEKKLKRTIVPNIPDNSLNNLFIMPIFELPKYPAIKQNRIKEHA